MGKLLVRPPVCNGEPAWGNSTETVNKALGHVGGVYARRLPANVGDSRLNGGSRYLDGRVESGEEKTARERVTARGEDALGEIAHLLAENPLLHQVVNATLGARDIANSATGSALKNLNIATAADLDRFARRLRSVSDRLEAVEDRLDALAGEIASLRTDPPAPPSRDVALEQERLGLSE